MSRSYASRNFLVGWGITRIPSHFPMPPIDQIDRRTDVVFILFHFQNTIQGVTKLQKLLFLIEQETEFFEEYKDDIAFNFAPYKMGPFSEHVYQELQFLLQLDAIESEPLDQSSQPMVDDAELTNKAFTLTSKGEKIAAELVEILDEEYRDELEDLVDTYGPMSLDELLEDVYRSYPAYTEESEIKDEVFAGGD